MRMSTFTAMTLASLLSGRSTPSDGPAHAAGQSDNEDDRLSTRLADAPDVTRDDRAAS